MVYLKKFILLIGIITIGTFTNQVAYACMPTWDVVFKENATEEDWAKFVNYVLTDQSDFDIRLQPIKGGGYYYSLLTLDQKCKFAIDWSPNNSILSWSKDNSIKITMYPAYNCTERVDALVTEYQESQNLPTVETTSKESEIAC